MAEDRVREISLAQTAATEAQAAASAAHAEWKRLQAEADRLTAHAAKLASEGTPSTAPSTAPSTGPSAAAIKRAARRSMIDFDDVKGKVIEVTSLAPAFVAPDAATMEAHSLTALITKFYQSEKAKLLGKSNVKEEKLMNYQPSLSLPLTKAMNKSKQDIKIALQCFKAISGFIGDRKTKKNEHRLINVLFSKAQTSQEVRDEIICQLMRQTHRNPSKECMGKAYTLLSICLSLFPPSPELKPFVGCYLQSQIGPGHTKTSGENLLSSQANLERSSLYGCRTSGPSEEEVGSVLSGKQVAMAVELLDGSPLLFRVQSHTTAADVSHYLTKLFRAPLFEERPCFGLAEQIFADGSFDFEQPISPHARLFDVMAGWEEMEEERGNVELTFKLVFKPRIFFFSLLKEGVLSDEGLKLYYLAAVQDVVRSVYGVKDEAMAVELAAAQLQVDHPNAENPTFELKKYLPALYLKPMDANPQLGQVWVTRILAARAKIGTNPKRHYLDLVQQSPHYGALSFRGLLTMDIKATEWNAAQGVRSSPDGENKIQDPLDWALAVGERGILFLEGPDRQIRKHVALSSINFFGVGPNNFWFSTGPLHDARICVYECKRGRGAEELVKLYSRVAQDIKARRTTSA